jgi:hypothetical protein
MDGPQTYASTPPASAHPELIYRRYIVDFFAM